MVNDRELGKQQMGTLPSPFPPTRFPLSECCRIVHLGHVYLVDNDHGWLLKDQLRERIDHMKLNRALNIIVFSWWFPMYLSVFSLVSP